MLCVVYSKVMKQDDYMDFVILDLCRLLSFFESFSGMWCQLETSPAPVNCSIACWQRACLSACRLFQIIYHVSKCLGAEHAWVCECVRVFDTCCKCYLCMFCVNKQLANTLCLWYPKITHYLLHPIISLSFCPFHLVNIIAILSTVSSIYVSFINIT